MKTKLNTFKGIPVETKNLDELETGPWPSFVTGLKRLAANEDIKGHKMATGVIQTLEESYKNNRGYWKGGTVGVVGYGGGIIPRFSELKDDAGEPKYPDALEFHTIRIQPPAGLHYTSDLLRRMCDVWEKHGTGLVGMHGQSGDIMFQGADTASVQAFFDEMNSEKTFEDIAEGFAFDLGGAGPAVRTSMSCVGAARCEQSCFNEQEMHRTTINEFLDDMHRPALPYKLKWKFSGCANDCTNAIHRADIAVIGTWRDDIKINHTAWNSMVEDKGKAYVIDNCISRCPSQAMSLNDDNSLEIDNRACVKCMHCINFASPLSFKYAGKDGDPILAQGDDKGFSVLVGGKRTLKIGDTMGTVIIPFMKADTEEGMEQWIEFCENHVDVFAENALEHERTGEMIERIGLPAYLEAIDIKGLFGFDVDPNMISSPRQSSYVRMDGWDEEVEKWNESKQALQEMYARKVA